MNFSAEAKQKFSELTSHASRQSDEGDLFYSINIEGHFILACHYNISQNKFTTFQNQFYFKKKEVYNMFFALNKIDILYPICLSIL